MGDNIFSKYNANTYERIDWNVNTDGFNYKKLLDVYNEGARRLDVYGLFLTKGGYGLQAVAIGKDCFYNLPSHKVEIVKKVLADSEAVAAIKQGRLQFVLRKYENKTGKVCVDFDFVEKAQSEPSGTKVPF